MTTQIRLDKKLLLAIIGILFLWGLNGQPLEVTNNPPITPENLISNVFLGEGVQVVSITFQGSGQSVGFFKNGEDEVGIERGIVMTTGNAVTQGANIGVDANGGTFASVNNNSSVGDADLNTIAAGASVNNVTKYIIEFIPISDTLRFKYAFGSEEYPEYACSQYNDIFGFFISGPGIDGGGVYQDNAINIARVPGTNLPVTINNVNSGMVGANGTIANCTPPSGTLAFSEFYNDNNNSGVMPVYDGMTDVFIAEAVVQPCNVYKIKLVICDVSDGAFDSGVFLEAKSFGTGTLNVEATTVSLDGSVAEGCSEGLLTFSLPRPVESDYPIDYQILGTAENGIDYVTIPPDLFIPAGDSSLSIPIIALEDGIMEGDETLLIDVQRDVCNRDTVVILIRENPMVPADLGSDTTICEGNSVQLDGTLDVPLPDPPTFSNTQELNIPSPITNNSPVSPVFSNVNVIGVIPPTLGPGVIKSVCIDSLTHRWIDDVDVYLISPGGQFIELTTDNGGNGGNGLGIDNYINTCFTLDAATPISFPGPFAPPEAAPFTGTWQPEGVWSDLWDSENPSNGTWQLQLVDDTPSLDGTLHSWTICFTPVYEIKYSWLPVEGLSCADCPNPVATPSETTTYVMSALDSYGCETFDSITIEVIEALDAPANLSCGTITDNTITVTWEDVPGSMGYEISIDGGPFVTVNGPLSHFVNGLNLSQNVTFEVRGIGMCPGFSAIVDCSTPDCTPPTASIATTPTNCFGGSDGTLTITPSGGNPPYTYEVNGVTNDTGEFSGLEGGLQQAMVVDAVGCPLQIDFTIDEPVGLDINTVIVSPISCNGANDGSITVTISGGTGPFTFNWDNASSDSIANNLQAGLHYLTITDGGGCTQIDSVDLVESEVLSLAMEEVDVSCGGAGDGRAIVTPQGGTPPYQFLWDVNANSQVTDTAFALSGGNFEVTLTDASGCEVIASAQIDENPILTLNSSATDASCDGVDNGTALTNAEGGTGVYTYFWYSIPDGNPVGISSDADQLGVGSYEVVMTDSEGCELRDTVEVFAPEALTFTINTEIPTCVGASDGQAAIVVEGGTPDYTFNWSDIGNGPADRDDLASNSYNVTVSDAEGCNIEISLEIFAPEALEVNFETTLVNCFEGNDGTATAMPTGGAGGFAYLWENGEDTPTASGLEAGMAAVTITDANGCTLESSVLVEEFDALTLSITGVDAACNGDDSGSATVTPNGGAGGYQYLWTDGQTESTAQNLLAGTHEVTVEDNNGCQTTIQINIGEPDILSATITDGLVSCNGSPDGSVSISVEGGTEPYTYLWNDGTSQNTSTASNLVSGTYVVTVTDANDCILIDTANVTPTTEVILALAQTDISCHAGLDGSIQITAQGGTGSYSYAWSEAGLPNTANPENLSAGSYTVTVTDTNGCMAEISTVLSEPDALVLTASYSDVLCANGDDGAINLQVEGGVELYTFRWNNNASTEDLIGLTAGDYSVTVTDDNGCTVNKEIIIGSPEALAATFEVDDIDCFGQQTGAIESSIRGGILPYSYDWSNNSNAPIINQLTAGSYILTITDVNGCILEETVDVDQPDAPIDAEIFTEDVSCYGGKDGILQIDATGGTPFYTYSMDGQNYSGSSRMIGLEEGSYRIFIRDSKGCAYVSQQVNIEEPDELTLDLGPDINIEYGEEITLSPDISGANGMVFYEWTPQDTSLISCIDCRNPKISVTYQTSFLLRIYDENGCAKEDIITVFVSKNAWCICSLGLFA